jgi:hypothetical protein
MCQLKYHEIYSILKKFTIKYFKRMTIENLKTKLTEVDNFYVKMIKTKNFIFKTPFENEILKM